MGCECFSAVPPPQKNRPYHFHLQLYPRFIVARYYLFYHLYIDQRVHERALQFHLKKEKNFKFDLFHLSCNKTEKVFCGEYAGCNFTLS